MKTRSHKRRKSQTEKYDNGPSKRPRREGSTEGPSLPSTDVIDLTADSDEEIVDAAVVGKEPAAPEYDTCFGLVSTVASLHVNFVIYH